jgi:hypothetical protein
MIVKTTVTRWDLCKIQLYFLPRAKSNYGLLFIIWAVYFFFFLYAVGFTGDTICKFCTLLSVLIFSFKPAVIATLLLFSIGVSITLLTAGHRPGVLGDHEFMLKDEGLFETTSVNETLTKWKGITSLTKTKRFIFIRLGPFFHFLPRNNFESHEQFNEFWEDLHNRWKNHHQ